MPGAAMAETADAAQEEMPETLPETGARAGSAPWLSPVLIVMGGALLLTSAFVLTTRRRRA